MVAPKYKAIELTNREEIKDAIKEIGKLQPNKEKLMLLIELFNQVHGTNIFTWNKYAGCGDCQRNLYKFWNYIIIEWSKK